MLSISKSFSGREFSEFDDTFQKVEGWLTANLGRYIDINSKAYEPASAGYDEDWEWGAISNRVRDECAVPHDHIIETVYLIEGPGWYMWNFVQTQPIQQKPTNYRGMVCTRLVLFIDDEMKAIECKLALS